MTAEAARGSDDVPSRISFLSNRRLTCDQLRAAVPLLTVLAGAALPVFAADARAAEPARARAATASHAIASLNRQRAAHGLPAGIVENPEWSEGCRLHMNYLSRNRLQLGHDEDPALPGYTELGARAGGSSVLSSSEYGADGRNPWENAPIHLMQLLSPALSVTGYAQGCMWTWPGYQRPAPPAPQLYSYPGANVTKFPASQSARESPFVPGDFVGLPQGATTGPHLYVLAFGAGSGRLTGALTGPNGPVAVRTVDNSTSSSLGNLGAYLPPGGIIIPVAPLKPNTTYTAYASFTDGTHTLARSWSFGTAPVPDTTAPVAKLTGRRSQKLGKTVAVTVSCISETCVATARGSARAPKLGAARAKTHRLKPISKAIVKGKKVKFKLKLTGKARKAIRRRLKSRKRVTVKVKVVVVDARSNAKTLKRSIKLKL